MTQRTIDFIPGTRLIVHFECGTSAFLGCHTISLANLSLQGFDFAPEPKNSAGGHLKNISDYFKTGELKLSQWGKSPLCDLASFKDYANTPQLQQLRKALLNAWCEAVYDLVRFCGYLFISDQINARNDEMFPCTSYFIKWMILEKKAPCVALPIIANPNYYFHKNPPPHIDQAFVFMTDKPHQRFGVAWDTLTGINIPTGINYEQMKRHFSNERELPVGLDTKTNIPYGTVVKLNGNSWKELAEDWLEPLKKYLPAFKPKRIKPSPRVSTRLAIYAKLKQKRAKERGSANV